MNIAGLLLSFGLLLIAMTVHEFAHGWIAYRLGDTTAKYSGRLTLNPLAHIDPIGTVVLPLLLFISTGGRFVFGAAKPVPINYWNFKHPRRDIMLVGAAGPMANFIFAVLLSLLAKFFHLPELLNIIFQQLIIINVVLGVFNLIPIPPLDGSRIMAGLLPPDLSYRYSAIEPYGFFIILLLVGLGTLNFVIWPIVNFILVFLIGSMG